MGEKGGGGDWEIRGTRSPRRIITRARRQYGGGQVSRGKCRVKLVPRPTSLLTSMLPL
jgi:hypothetical protein